MRENVIPSVLKSGLVFLIIGESTVTWVSWVDSIQSDKQFFSGAVKMFWGGRRWLSPLRKLARTPMAVRVIHAVNCCSC